MDAGKDGWKTNYSWKQNATNLTHEEKIGDLKTLSICSEFIVKEVNLKQCYIIALTLGELFLQFCLHQGEWMKS